MNSATSEPTFSMWCREPEAAWKLYADRLAFDGFAWYIGRNRGLTDLHGSIAAVVVFLLLLFGAGGWWLAGIGSFAMCDPAEP